MINIAIKGPFSSQPDFKLSGWVEYMLEDQTPSNRYWFALNQDSIAVGGLKLTLKSGPTARDITGDTAGITELSVDPKFQRQGIATALMRSCESWVKAQPDLPQAIGLGVDTDNHGAISLYQKEGYQVAKRQSQPITFRGSDGNQCYVMFKRLG